MALFLRTYGLKSNKVSPAPWSAAQPVWEYSYSCCAMVLFRIEAVSVGLPDILYQLES